MLPYLAMVAAGDSKWAASARAHLNALASAAPAATRKLAKTVEKILATERGSILEPFHCTETTAPWIALAASMLVNGEFRADDMNRSVLITDRMIDCDFEGFGGQHRRWSGLTVSGEGVAPFRLRDFRRRLFTQSVPIPAIPLSFDIQAVGTQAIRRVACALNLGGKNASLDVEVARAAHHTRTAGQTTLAAYLHFVEGGLVPITGRTSVRASPHPTEIFFDLNPTMLLRIAALPGPKRFMIRIAESEPTGTTPLLHSHEELVVGSFDEDGARAVWLPRDGWADFSADWMPAVRFAGSGSDAATTGPLGQCSPGTLSSLIDLLVQMQGHALHAATEKRMREKTESLLAVAEQDFLTALRRQLHRDAISHAARARS
jgi:hypothetical protein